MTTVPPAHDPPPPGAADRDDPYLGRVFAGKYRIEKLLAFGGMGRVYRGVQQPLERPVAVKIMSPLNSEAESDEVYAKRFFREARITSQFSHPNTVVIHDYGAIDEPSGQVLYLIMEFLDGRTLRDLIRDHGPLPIPRAVHIARQLCASLLEAHEQGVLHRDIKPPNIILVHRGTDRDFVKVVDFGLVKSIEEGEDDEVTREDTFVGSPLYMAPEQFTRRQTTVQSEIYSIGVILYEMLTGRPPFRRAPGMGVADLIIQHVTAPVPPLESIVPQLAEAETIRAVIHRCLAKEPDERFESTRELLDLLEEYDRALITGDITAQGSLATPLVDLDTAPGARAPVDAAVNAAARRSPLPLIIGALALVGVTVAAVLLLDSDDPDPSTLPPAAPVAGPEAPRGDGLGGSKGAGAGEVQAPVAAPTERVEPAPTERVEPAPTERVEPAPPAVDEAALAALRASVARARAAALVAALTPRADLLSTHVTVALTSRPSGAAVTLGEQALGVTPARWRTPRSAIPDDGVSFLFRLRGHQAARVTLEVSDAPTAAVEARLRRQRPTEPSDDGRGGGDDGSGDGLDIIPRR